MGVPGLHWSRRLELNAKARGQNTVTIIGQKMEWNVARRHGNNAARLRRKPGVQYQPQADEESHEQRPENHSAAKTKSSHGGNLDSWLLAPIFALSLGLMGKATQTKKAVADSSFPPRWILSAGSTHLRGEPGDEITTAKLTGMSVP